MSYSLELTYTRSAYDETWIALNWHIVLPTQETHPKFPLWRLGYTPEDVYDSFFPKDFTFICNPDRPAICGRFGLPLDRLWRYEFVVQKGEDRDRMATYEETSKIIFPYLTHAGSRYGLDHSVQYPEDCIQTLRSRPFSFVARSCNKWALGRVILAGDAAHVFPPFGESGICRDSILLTCDRRARDCLWVSRCLCTGMAIGSSAPPTKLRSRANIDRVVH